MSEATKTATVSADDPAIVAAAKWWADVLRGPTKFDNGDNSQAGGMAWAMATMAASESKPAPDVIDRFEAELRQSIAQYVNERDGRFWPTVATDYGPDRILSDAFERAGGKGAGLVFPWKTVMWVRPDEVTVRYGYGAPEQVIYPTE